MVLVREGEIYWVMRMLLEMVLLMVGEIWLLPVMGPETVVLTVGKIWLVPTMGLKTALSMVEGWNGACDLVGWWSANSLDSCHTNHHHNSHLFQISFLFHIGPISNNAVLCCHVYLSLWSSFDLWLMRGFGKWHDYCVDIYQIVHHGYLICFWNYCLVQQLQMM